MTRGTVILKNGKVFIALGYSNSDSYPSGEIGQMLVKALSNSSDEETVQIIKNYIDGLQKKEEEFSKDCMEYLREIGEAFYNKKAAAKAGLGNGYYYDYSYVYDIKTRKLQIFYYGKLEYSFKKEDFPYFKLVVENNELFAFVFRYDTKSKQLKGGIGTVAKEVKRLKKAGLSPKCILGMAKELAENIHYVVDKYFFQDCWKNTMKKVVTFYPNHQSLEFIFQEEFGECNVYIQLPWVRQGIIHCCSSRQAAMKRLIAYLDNNWESLQSGMALYELYEDCHKKLMNFYNTCDKVSITEDEFNEAVGQIEKEFRDKLIPLEELDYSGWPKEFGPNRAKKKIAEWIFKTHRHIFDCIQKS